MVDDAEPNRDLLSRRLQQHRYDVLTASDGRAALELVARGDVCLVLLDVEMPEMSGLEVLRSLRQRHTRVELPVIMVTARQESKDVVEALTIGANDYVTKPVDFPVALARIETQLSLQYAAAALRDSEERYTLAVRGANDGIWDWNLRTGALYVSPRWKLMLGLDEGEPIARPDDWLDRVHEHDATSLRESIERHVAGHTPQFENEHRVRHEDGSYRWVLARGLAIRDGDESLLSHGRVDDRHHAGQGVRSVDRPAQSRAVPGPLEPSAGTEQPTAGQPERRPVPGSRSLQAGER